MPRAGPVMSIDLGALAANWQALATFVAPARCGAVVKADAYGLGATPVVRALLQAGCREFFVALVDEGMRLRDSLAASWPADARLHVLHGAPPGTEADCLACGLVPVLHSVDQVQRWQALARREGRALPAALQVDTGMARLGLPPAALGRLLEAGDGLPGIATTLLMSHLVQAENPLAAASRHQLALFRPWRARFPAALGCLAHSAGIFLGSDFHFDLVRPGAALYGATPANARGPALRQVVHLHDDERDIDTLARQAGTSAYELLTGLALRFRRQYLGDVSL